MFKSNLTQNLFDEFVSSHLSVKKFSHIQHPFVYVDGDGYKLIADVLNGDFYSEDNTFAVSMAEDGWIELINLFE